MKHPLQHPTSAFHLKPSLLALGMPAVIAILLTISTAHAQTLTPLHTFNGRPDGRYPVAGPAHGCGRQCLWHH